MSAAIINRIRKTLQGAIDEIYAGFSGEHSLADVANAIEARLRLSPEILPAVRDIAHLVAEAEDHRRCSMAMPKTLSLFGEDWARLAEIRLGNGQRVTWANATPRQVRRKHAEQIRGILRDTEAAALTADVVELFDEHPDAANVAEVMRKAGVWSDDHARLPPDIRPVA